VTDLMTGTDWQSPASTSVDLTRPESFRLGQGRAREASGWMALRAATEPVRTRPSRLEAMARCSKQLHALARRTIEDAGLRVLALAIATLGLAAISQPAFAQVFRIDTVLGDFDPLEEVPLSQAWTENPAALAVDSAGNLYFAEARTGRVRKVNQLGQVSTVAGSGLTGDSGDGGPATRARFGRIEGLALDRAGNIYIADADKNRIRRVDGTGTIETIAGTGRFGWQGDGGPAVSATLTAMSGVATDQSGNLYIADTWADRIRRIDSHGTISTVVGTGEEGRSGDGGPAIEARLNRPRGVAIDDSGNIYIADTENHLVRRVDASGTISTLAGTGDAGYSGDGGAASDAQLDEPHAVAIDPAGNVFIADTRNRTIRKVDAAGIITTVVGTGPRGRGGVSGIGTEVRMSRPRALAIGRFGSVYIADEWANRILRLDTAGIIEVFVGLGRREFQSPGDIAVDAEGNAYVVFRSMHTVLRVEPSGLVVPFAGSGRFGFSGDGGPAVDARLAFPSGVATDDRGNVYIADNSNHRIRVVDRAGTIETIAGTGTRGFGGDGGPATNASFQYPAAVAAGADGSVYVADRRNNRIRMIDSAGIVTTIAGNGRIGLPEPDAAAIRSPLGSPGVVGVDSQGRVYIPDPRTRRVYMVDNAGVLRIVAGNGEFRGGGDGGPATSASVGRPQDVAISDTDTLYIADALSDVIRKVTTDGIITTIAGTGTGGYNGDGSPAREYQLRSPTAVAARSDRKVWVADGLNHRVRTLTLEIPPPSVSSVLNGASHNSTLAPGAVALIRGTDLSSYPTPATGLPRAVPLPTSLLGTSVIISEGNEPDSTKREAGLYAVSPTEVRFQMPEDTPLGQVNLTVLHEGSVSEPVTVQVSRVAPGLFSANGNGQGVAAAMAVRVARDGTRTPLEVSRYDPEQKRYIAVPLDIRADFSPVYLTLYGTGALGGERPPDVLVQDRHVAVQSAEPSSVFPGVEELVIGPIRRSIRNREIEIIAIVDGRMSNAVTIALT